MCVAVAPRGVVVVAEFDDAFEFRVVVVGGASRAAASDASSNAGIAGGPRRAPRRDDARARVRRVANASSNATSRVDIDRSRARARRARRRVTARATKTTRDPRRRRGAHARRMARASGDDARDRRRSFRCRDVVDAVVDGDDGARARVVNVNGVARVEVSSRAGAGARAGRVGPVDALRAACACATAATFESRNAREAAEGARAVRAMLALVRMVCERAAWVDANGFASAEGSEEEFHDAEDEEEVGARTVRAVTRGIVERVIEDAERERGVRACVETAVASVVKANANARFERTPKKSTGEGPKKAFSFLKTPKSAGSRTKSMTTPASASASTPASTPKPKSAMEVKLSDALSAARAKAKEIEDELADSPLRSPFKQRMKAGVREHPIRRLQGAAVRLYKRTKHNVIKRVERATEKNPTAVGGGVLGFAVLVLASRRGRGP